MGEEREEGDGGEEEGGREGWIGGEGRTVGGRQAERGGATRKRRRLRITSSDVCVCYYGNLHDVMSPAAITVCRGGAQAARDEGQATCYSPAGPRLRIVAGECAGGTPPAQCQRYEAWWARGRGRSVPVLRGVREQVRVGGGRRVAVATGR